MTVALAASEAAARIKEKFPGSVMETRADSVVIRPESLVEVLGYLKTKPGLEFNYLNSIIAVDYWDYFEVIYQLVSLSLNHNLVIKVRCPGRDNLSLPSAVSLYKSADFQEREIFDLFGIRFEGHPNLKRLFLWEGFQGYPLRKDYL
jgi:NADH-quinone oxidoreductase subunit C